MAYVAHPSLLTDDEILAISGPITIAAAGKSTTRENFSIQNQFW